MHKLNEYFTKTRWINNWKNTIKSESLYYKIVNQNKHNLHISFYIYLKLPILTEKSIICCYWRWETLFIIFFKNVINIDRSIMIKLIWTDMLVRKLPILQILQLQEGYVVSFKTVSKGFYHDDQQLKIITFNDKFIIVINSLLHLV